jgi:hypothetical protein
MSLVSSYASTLREQYRMHAVWPPLVAPVALGDYGQLHDGAFVRLGNVTADFGIAVEALPPAEHASLVLTSSGVKAMRLQGNVPVGAFVPGARATLELNFTSDNGAVVRAARMRALGVANVVKIGDALGDVDAWRRSYSFVTTIYATEEATVLATAKRGALVKIEGDAGDLIAFEATGKLSAGLTFTSEQELTLQMAGKRGPIGLGLHRRNWLGNVKPRGVDAPPDPLTLTPLDAEDDY